MPDAIDHDQRAHLAEVAALAGLELDLEHVSCHAIAYQELPELIDARAARTKSQRPWSGRATAK